MYIRETFLIHSSSNKMKLFIAILFLAFSVFAESDFENENEIDDFFFVFEALKFGVAENGKHTVTKIPKGKSNCTWCPRVNG